MKFWNFSTSALAILLASVSLANASGPSDGEAAADPNSAVVKLSAENFKAFIDENPLVLAEFFAPWCGYCKVLGPEFSKASNILNETHPNIKLAQIDCTENEQLCQQHQIRGYPSLKVFRSKDKVVDDYEGPREANGIVDFMIKESLPAIQEPSTIEEFAAMVKGQLKPYLVHINGAGSAKEAFESVSQKLRKSNSFISIKDKSIIDDLKSKIDEAKGEIVELVDNGVYLIYPDLYDDVRTFVSNVTDAANLEKFINVEGIPYFGDIGRDTYQMYMNSDLPLAYYFYDSIDRRAEYEPLFTELAKKYKGKLNFVGLDANLYGRHAEILSMDPAVVPLFAIHNTKSNLKYGINQTEHPEGPSKETITEFLEKYFAEELEPVFKSEEIPTAEEKNASPVVKIVGKNHADIVGDIEKDVFVKYYAPWCGHCKKLAPIWEELAEIYGSNKDNAKVIISNMDHTANDAIIPYEIEGYPTLLLYPANGEIDEKTGVRKPIIFEQPRDLEHLVSFLKEHGTHKDAHPVAEKDEEVEEKEEEAVAPEDIIDDVNEAIHDEL